MKVKTAELIGPALDWAVAQADGKDVTITQAKQVAFYPKTASDGAWRWYQPSSNWAEGGPIIEREFIWLSFEHGDGGVWAATLLEPDGHLTSKLGITPLQAAMRCFVASELGDEVEIPDELVTAR